MVLYTSVYLVTKSIKSWSLQCKVECVLFRVSSRKKEEEEAIQCRFVYHYYLESVRGAYCGGLVLSMQKSDAWEYIHNTSFPNPMLCGL